MAWRQFCCNCCLFVGSVSLPLHTHSNSPHLPHSHPTHPPRNTKSFYSMTLRYIVKEGNRPLGLSSEPVFIPNVSLIVGLPVSQPSSASSPPFSNTCHFPSCPLYHQKIRIHVFLITWSSHYHHYCWSSWFLHCILSRHRALLGSLELSLIQELPLIQW